MRSKSLTYNRFRAYLRVKLKNKHFKKRLIFAILFYFLCSLTIFLLPLDILTKYPYLKYFTDFMDFIPAIKLMESKTFAPELCKFYASYMFVVGVVVLVEMIWQSCIRRSKLPQKLRQDRMQEAYDRPALYIFYMIICYSLILFCIRAFLNGKFIGYIPKVDEKYHFIYNIFDMLWYVDYYQVLVIGGIYTFRIGIILIANLITNHQKIKDKNE